jgi:hypothetical protein
MVTSRRFRSFIGTRMLAAVRMGAGAAALAHPHPLLAPLGSSDPVTILLARMFSIREFCDAAMLLLGTRDSRRRILQVGIATDIGDFCIGAARIRAGTAPIFLNHVIAAAGLGTALIGVAALKKPARASIPTNASTRGQSPTKTLTWDRHSTQTIDLVRRSFSCQKHCGWTGESLSSLALGGVSAALMRLRWRREEHGYWSMISGVA